MSKGKIYLIPTTLGDTNPLQVVAAPVADVIKNIHHYIVENEKHARRYLRKLDIPQPIDTLTLYPLNKHTAPEDLPTYLKPALNGENMGVISEAGCPGVADPGSEIVRLAHEKNIAVVPLVGPSSILLALMASGMNGQQFAFHGYLPKDRKERIRKLREMEKAAGRQTQLFMDTPFRNNHVLEDLLQTCAPTTRLCIAADITLPSEYIKTQTIQQWKKTTVNLHKRPCIFLLG